MIAEGPLRSPLMGRHNPFGGKFGMGHQRMTAGRVFHHLQLVSQQQRGEHQFGNVLRQRGNGRHHQRRRAADKEGHRQVFIALLRLVVMIPPPL